MAGTDWPFTMLGKTFFDGTLPALVKNVGRLADELKRYNDKCLLPPQVPSAETTPSAIPPNLMALLDDFHFVCALRDADSLSQRHVARVDTARRALDSAIRRLLATGKTQCHRIGGHLSEGCGCETGQLDFPNGIEQEPKERIFVCDGHMCGNIGTVNHVEKPCGCCPDGIVRAYVREKK